MVAVGVYVINSNGPRCSGSAALGRVSLQDSHVAVTQSTFKSSSAISLSDCSLGSSNVFGGAVAVVQWFQVSNVSLGLLMSENVSSNSIGFNTTMSVSNSNFSQCSVFSNATSGRLGEAYGGGGALFAKSVGLSNFSIIDSTFVNNSMTIAGSDSGVPSFSSGGALTVSTGSSIFSVVRISSCVFTRCRAQGANVANMAVRGGAIDVSRATNFSIIRTNFTNCSVMDGSSGGIVSGGSAISSALIGHLFLKWCVFDFSGGPDKSSSAGLLILARNSSSASAFFSDCVLISSAVVLSVQCVGDDGLKSFPFDVFCLGPHLFLRESNVSQLAPQGLADFNVTGSLLMTLQNPQTISFTGSRLLCALPQFAAFKEQSPKQFSDFFCKPCAPFYISLSANAVLLEDLSNAKNTDRCFPASDKSDSFSCPFAVSQCTTFVSVSSGFWTNVTESGTLNRVRRCPRGYCGCSNPTNGTCSLPSLMSISRQPDPLCKGNRTGTLCGGCADNFTQSMDDATCISNEVCSQNLWWVWMLSILGFALYGLFIVMSCRQRGGGEFSCLMFYFQMSLFATFSISSTSLFANSFAKILEFAQMRSIVTLYPLACYAPGMKAYNAKVFSLVGPLFVLLFALTWTCIIKALHPRLLQYNTDIAISYSGTLSVTILFVFSSVTQVVFTLLQCTSYTDPDAVVFIDGTVSCSTNRLGLIFVATLLFLFPAAFAASLHLKKLPPIAQNAVCGRFTKPMYYWGAVSLSFRLFISVTQFLQVEFPNLLAFVRLFLSICVFFLLVNLRPYVDNRTFWVDVVCYVCLIAQFGLQIIAADRDYLGVAEASDQEMFVTGLLILSACFKCVHLALECHATTLLCVDDVAFLGFSPSPCS